MADWKPATTSRGPSKKGAVVEIQPAERAVAVIQFGGLPAIDVQAANMARFITTNYGSAGGKAKKFQMTDGKTELRRVVGASGNEELDIVHDIATAAKAIKKDAAQEKVVALVLHGNDEGVSRVYRRGMLEHMLHVDQMRDVNDFRMELARLSKEEERRKADLANARTAKDPEAIDEAQFHLRDVQTRIAQYEASLPAAEQMSNALKATAEALADAGVSVLELQACNVGDIEGVASFSFAERLQSLLSTPQHRLKIRTHRRWVTTGVHSKTKKTMVWLGAKPESEGNGLSETTLPPFIDP
jgi:hypothetical protein